MGEKSGEIDRAGRRPDGKLFMRRGTFTRKGLSQYFATMMTILGEPEVTLGDFVSFKVRQQEQKAKKGMQ
jgi:hypothetical protein